MKKPAKRYKPTVEFVIFKKLISERKRCDEEWDGPGTEKEIRAALRAYMSPCVAFPVKPGDFYIVKVTRVRVS